MYREMDRNQLRDARRFVGGPKVSFFLMLMYREMDRNQLRDGRRLVGGRARLRAALVLLADAAEPQPK